MPQVTGCGTWNEIQADPTGALNWEGNTSSNTALILHPCCSYTFCKVVLSPAHWNHLGTLKPLMPRFEVAWVLRGQQDFFKTPKWS